MDNEYNYYVPNQPEGTFEEPNQPKKHKPKIPKVVITICLALVFGLVGSVTFQASNYVANRFLGASNKTAKKVETVANSKATKTSNTVTSDVSAVVNSAMPSVVSITNMSVQQVQNFFGGVSEREQQSSGSGIIIGQNDTELLIVTNNHVVEGSETLTVSFIDDASVEAQVKGTDATKDLAVVAVKTSDIEKKTMDAIAVATLGDSTAIQVGESAIAIGNALGYGQSVTTGVISAVNRDIKMEGFDSKLIQTDAAINPGNSGGALLNANGEVIGINTVKVNSSAVEGMGYAIPVSDVSDAITELMNKKTRTKVAESEKGYLGIKGVDVTDESSKMYSMPTGVYVSEAIEGGGAAQANIIKGSIITSLDGTNIDNMATLQETLAYYAAGDKVKVTLQVQSENGEYKETSVEVTLTKNIK
ncbi:MAG: trypsin-like peptidase domain-containing protein [Lachnospiraceae bacterium]